MTNHVAGGQFVDLEIRIFPRQDEGYPVEITLGGQQEFPRGVLAAPRPLDKGRGVQDSTGCNVTIPDAGAAGHRA